MGKSKKIASASVGQGPASVGNRKRQAIRPVDRKMKMREWLVTKLNADELSDALWWTHKNTEFAIKWTHAARHGYTVLEDAKLTKAWAIHSGIFQEGDPEDHKKWKSNFRCALHSLIDVVEVGPVEKRKGQHAMRIFKLLDKAEVKPRNDKPGRRYRKQFVVKEEQQMLQKDNSDDSGASTGSEPSNTNSTPPHIPAHVDCSLPDFCRLGLNIKGSSGRTTSVVQRNLLSGGLVIKNESRPTDIQPNPVGTLSFNTSSPSAYQSSFSFPIPIPASLNKKPTMSISTTLTSVSMSRSSAETVFQKEEQGTVANEHPTEVEDKDDGMMRPVATMTFSRIRTPSGDSGHPNSPGCEEEVGEVVEAEDVSEEITLSPGGGSSIRLKDLEVLLIANENGTMTAIEQPQEMDWADIDLSNLTNCPETAVTVEPVKANEADFSFTSLCTLDPGL